MTEPNDSSRPTPPAEDETREWETVDSADPAAHDDPPAEEADAVAEEESETERGDPYGGHAPEAVQRILEGALFAAGTALSVPQLAALFQEHERPHRAALRTLLAELQSRYSGGGFELVEVASGYRFQTREDIGPWVSRLWEEKPPRYSRAMLETLALIAYRQPITRGEIEDVRGVSVSSGIIKTLQEREWVRIVGHRDVPGRPAMYATTRQFLDYFGLKSLDQLPSLGEIRDLDDFNPELGLDDQEGAEAGSVDAQSEMSFSAMVDKLREGDRSGKTGNEFIDEQLDGQLTEMDAVNEAIEQAFDAQRAEHNQPGLNLDEADESAEEATDDSTLSSGSEDSESGAEAAAQKQDAADEPESEAEKLRIIQEKLAQQQAYLDAQNEDTPSTGDEHDDD